MAAFESELFDVGAGGFRHSQSVEGEEAEEGVVAGRR